MPVQTRARAKATDKPPSPLKNILKAPARRAAKARTASSTTSSDAKVVKKSPARGVGAAPKARRAALSGSLRSRKTKLDATTRGPHGDMELDHIMVDAPCAPELTVGPVQEPMALGMVSDAASRHQTPAKPSKLPKPSHAASPAQAVQAVQATPSRNENTPLRHKISSTRLAKTAVVKKPSKEGLMSRSPLKSSLSLQSLLSPKRPRNTEQLSANDTKQFNFSGRPAQGCDAPVPADDVFQDRHFEPIFKYSSILSPEKLSFTSPRKAVTHEKLLSASPSRKSRSPEKRCSPLQSPPTSPDRLIGSMIPFGPLFPGLPTSPISSPEQPVMRVATSPRKPLSEVGAPTIPARSSSRSPTKHQGDPLVSRSPSKVPRLSPSKTSLKNCESVSMAPPTRLSTSRRAMPQSPTKSSIRSPTRSKSTPTLSPKKSVTWGGAQHPKSPSYPDSNALTGCVFYVDVRTAEGNDAGPLFIPLLKDMGASVVSHWTSNSMPVTHVLFKDGDDRTLEKVVASNGGVKCVNVGWAVDCERFNKRLPEHDYAIDLSRIPGQTPTTTPRSKPLSPLAPSHSVAATPIPQTPMPQTSLNINNAKISITTPAFLAGSKTCGAKSSSFNMSFQPSLTHVENMEEDKENLVPDDNQPSSPATPYFLHPQDLVQKSCPPKPALRGGADGNLDSRSREMNKRLMLAKRKSMEWAPKVSSPLRLSSGGEEA